MGSYRGYFSEMIWPYRTLPYIDSYMSLQERFYQDEHKRNER